MSEPSQRQVAVNAGQGAAAISPQPGELVAIKRFEGAGQTLL